MLPKTLYDLLQNPDCPNGVIADAIQDEVPGWPNGDTMATIYVVEGTTGEYSDRQYWNVAAFLDEVSAVGLRDRLNQWCKEHGCSDNRLKVGDFDDDDRDWENMKPGEDPDFRNDYTGTEYLLNKIPLRG